MPPSCLDHKDLPARRPACPFFGLRDRRPFRALQPMKHPWACTAKRLAFPQILWKSLLKSLCVLLKLPVIQGDAAGCTRIQRVHIIALYYIAIPPTA